MIALPGDEHLVRLAAPRAGDRYLIHETMRTADVTFPAHELRWVLVLPVSGRRAGPCRPDEFGDPHNFHQRRPSDWIDQCSKCGWVIAT